MIYEVAEIVFNFIIGIIGRIVSSVSSTYLVRLLDKITHKSNRLHLMAVIFVRNFI